MSHHELNLDEITPDEVADLAAACLERLEPGRQPLPLFTQMARLVVTSIVEIVPFDSKSDWPSVLMAKRPDDDPWWPGEWHLPGAVLLPTDVISDRHDYNTPVTRLLAEDFKNSVVIDGQVRIFDTIRRSGVRGSEQVALGWTNVMVADGVAEVVDGTFFDADHIERELAGEAVVRGHLPIIRSALDHYRQD
jgi:hypothetical protein